MIEIRHEKLNIEKPYRCIVVSDIHSHLDRFKQLLKEAISGEKVVLIENY